MLYPSIDSLLKQVGSKYLLVNIVAKRAKEMDETGHFQVKNYKSAKNIGKALEEVKQGLVHMEEEK